MKRFSFLLILMGIILICAFLSGCGTITITPLNTVLPVVPTGTEKPASIPPVATFPTIPVSTATTVAYTLKINDRYPFFTTRMIIGVSLTASLGRVWLGTLNGTIEEIDSRSGAFGLSIPVTSGAGVGSMILFPVQKMAFEGDYLWAWGNHIESGRAHPYLFAIDISRGTIARQWDLDSPEWTQNQERMFPPADFGASPGKIWMDNHVIDTQTYEVTADIAMPAITHFAYNGQDWMWLTGDTGHGDGLVFINTDDPSQGRYQTRWPFLVHRADGSSGVGPGNPLVLVGDRIWIGKSISGENPTYLLEAYTADLDQLMNETGPLSSVPLLDNYQKINMLYAGNYLWLVYTHGEKGGVLCQLDPQTGETLNTLDLIGDEGRSISDMPMDMASEGDDLWVLTARQLLRIHLLQTE